MNAVWIKTAEGWKAGHIVAIYPGFLADVVLDDTLEHVPDVAIGLLRTHSEHAAAMLAA